MLTPADHDRIHAAIAAAEAKTSGEIFCVVAGQSGVYRDVPLIVAAATAFLLPPLALMLGLRPGVVLGFLDSGWRIAHAGAVDLAMFEAVIAYALVQAALFAIAWAIAAIPAIHRALIPRAVKAARVHAKAMEQFVHRLHASTAPACVLIYLSLAERRVEIIGEDAIHAEVGDALWNRAIQAAFDGVRTGDVAQGAIAAVEICGAALAEHFPADADPRRFEDDDVAEV